MYGFIFASGKAATGQRGFRSTRKARQAAAGYAEYAIVDHPVDGVILWYR